MHYLVTGHTGFKGAWLTLWLAQRGHSVSGIALDPEPASLFEVADVSLDLVHDFRLDIRDAVGLREALAAIQPDVVFHMAAQPLVRESYRDPRTTIETNVMGTMNVLQAVSGTPSVKAQVVVTTDKVYRNVNQIWGYRESDPLGGDDPYSASKAMADILTTSWTRSFGGPPTAIARAGNVIGGGDVSKDRLLPDLLRRFGAGQPVDIRYPDAVRPWQHVLDCLNGYLAILDALLDGRGTGSWNIGPDVESFVPVRTIADRVVELWGGDAAWNHVNTGEPHEADLLALDARRAQVELGWRNRLNLDTALDWTVSWERRRLAGSTSRGLCRDQVLDFERLVQPHE